MKLTTRSLRVAIKWPWSKQPRGPVMDWESPQVQSIISEVVQRLKASLHQHGQEYSQIRALPVEENQRDYNKNGDTTGRFLSIFVEFPPRHFDRERAENALREVGDWFETQKYHTPEGWPVQYDILGTNHLDLVFNPRARRPIEVEFLLFARAPHK
jgi:hypothetical protein